MSLGLFELFGSLGLLGIRLIRVIRVIRFIWVTTGLAGYGEEIVLRVRECEW